MSRAWVRLRPDILLLEVGMALVLTDAGAAFFLTDQFRSGQDFVLHLFTNNYTPTDASALASFTEAAGGGYAAKTLSGGSWTIADDGAGILTASYAQQTWTFTGPMTGNVGAYGYYVTNGTTVVWAERLDEASIPVTPAVNGDVIRITPKYKRSKGTPA